MVSEPLHDLKIALGGFSVADCSIEARGDGNLLYGMMVSLHLWESGMK